MGFVKQNWRLFVALAGAALIGRKILQRRRSIDLNGQVVLVTGGSRGLGLATAEEFARQGARIVICARNEEELHNARLNLSEWGTEVLALPGDISDPLTATRIVEAATDRFGRIDILVNNAGVIMAGPWQTLTRDDYEEAMNIMFWGLYNMTMAALPQMVERKSGHIVNITSIGGKVSVPHLLPYSTAKFAAVGFSEGLHAELHKDKVYVTTVAPGLMRTGSTYNTVMKGDEHKTEYALFTVLDTLPATSTSVKHAARVIVEGTRRGVPEIIITLPAQLMARIYGAFPELVAETMGIANLLLPTSNDQGKDRHSGRESETRITRSFLTRLGQRAAREYNEHPSD